MSQQVSVSRPEEAEMLDPDVRFLLANERTLLAWLRTALAVMAGGLALMQFGERTSMRVASGIAAIALGVFMAVLGYMRFRAADRAIRAAQLPSIGQGPIIQVGSVIVFAVVLIALEAKTLL